MPAANRSGEPTDFVHAYGGMRGRFRCRVAPHVGALGRQSLLGAPAFVILNIVKMIFMTYHQCKLSFFSKFGVAVPVKLRN
ncbi:hypothetical protein [Acidovorax sp. LjRoot74]|uniref:hypothetical protein n=1 Tax=Acidovorax sp. LjRoot74 TaxID=3342337 RepID=UPI003F50D1E3